MSDSQQVGERLSLVLDDELRQSVSRIAERSKEGVAAILRKAIRCGIPLVERPGGYLIHLDSSVQSDILQAAEVLKEPVEKVLLAAIRIGAGPYFQKRTRRFFIEEKEVSQEDYESVTNRLADADDILNPNVQEQIAAYREIRSLRATIAELESTCPQVAERIAVKKQLRELQLAKSGSATVHLGTPTEVLKAEIAKLEDESHKPAGEAISASKPEKSKKKAK